MNSGQPYRDRREAGQILAAHVREEIGGHDAVVFALPRGGVPVGFEVARALDAPLDIIVVRKLGVPEQPEAALGAIAGSGYEVLDRTLVARLGISPLALAALADRQAAELQRREARYRPSAPRQDVSGRTAIVVDDGLATGLTMRAALGAVRELGARRVVVAAPVGAPDACAELADVADDVVCPFQPTPFHAVSLWYRTFDATSDEEVIECLAAAALNRSHAAHPHA